jgi:apolipoprotein N-acyltransferase
VAVLRGVEEGFAIARAARSGVLTLSDDRGPVLAKKATQFGRFALVSGKVNVRREDTFYARTGDWFAWVCMGGLIALMILRFAQSSPA